MAGEDTVAVKFALLCPTGTVTPEGTLTLALLLESATVTLAGAGPVSVTVQDELPGAFTVDDEQFSALNGAVRTGWLTVITPPVPDALMELPAEVAATTPPI